MSAGRKRLGHVVGLVLDAFAVVRVARRHAEAADLLAINARLVEAAGRDVEACAHQAGRNIKGATEAVHGIAALEDGLGHHLVWLGGMHGSNHLLEVAQGAHALGRHVVVTADPAGRPVIGREKPHLDACGLRPCTRHALLVPDAHAPGDVLAACKRLARPVKLHGRRLLAARVPEGRAVLILADHLAGALGDAVLVDPGQVWAGDAQPQRVGEALGGKVGRTHG